MMLICSQRTCGFYRLYLVRRKFVPCPLGHCFAEATTSYLDSVSPYARRLIDQVDESLTMIQLDGLPQQSALPNNARHHRPFRSLFGSVTTDLQCPGACSISRAGPISPWSNILYGGCLFHQTHHKGHCSRCHLVLVSVVKWLKKLLVTRRYEKQLESGPSRAWPPAWPGPKSLAHNLFSLGYENIRQKPWKNCRRKRANWILLPMRRLVSRFIQIQFAQIKRGKSKNGEEPNLHGKTLRERQTLHFWQFFFTQRTQSLWGPPKKHVVSPSSLEKSSLFAQDCNWQKKKT